MTRRINDLIDDILRREGGYVDHPADRGGPTKFGITMRTLSSYLGHEVQSSDIKSLQRHIAAEIYEQVYYAAPKLDMLPPSITGLVFDSAVNHGPRRAIRFVQQVCDEAGFGPVQIDGICGPETQERAAIADGVMGIWFLAAIAEERRNFYHMIVAADPSQAVFLKGWINRLEAFDDAVGRLVA